MPDRIFRGLLHGRKNRKYRNVIISFLALTLTLGVGMLVIDAGRASQRVTKIRRNDYGEGEKKTSLRLWIDGKEQSDPVEISVGEKCYREDEMNAFFSRCGERLEKEILGRNRDLEHVTSDLNLVTELAGEPVRIEWESDRYDLVSSFGERREENIEKEPEGVLVTLTARLTYTQDEKRSAVRLIPVRLYPKERSRAQWALGAAKETIEQKEEQSRENDEFILPTRAGGQRIELRNPTDPRGWYVLLLGGISTVLLFLNEKEQEKKKQKKREQQMLVDYPEILDKLALLLGAGTTVKGAFTRIVSDYERRREEQGIRYAYEEMAAACREMQSGMTEAESYERFGVRCGLREYRKLSTLLSQNLRKGTKGLTELLRTEAWQAFEERKASAVRKGEEAGTKLLGPMFCMLAIVLIIVIVPAFLAIQI